MAHKVAAFFRGLLEGLRINIDTSPRENDTVRRNNDSDIIQRNIYGEALYHELQYQLHVKEFQDFTLERDRRYRRLQDSAYERNMHLRVMKLPAEILSLIFHCMRLPPSYIDDPATRERFPFKQRPAEWVYVTWVCRQWRNVAVNDSTLWTIVPDHWSKWTPAIIERCRNTGLKVDFAGVQRSFNFFDFVLKHSDRISQLNLNDAALAYISSHFDVGSMPKLERLRIARSPPQYLELGQGKKPSLPTNMFNDSENLSYLELSGMQVFLAPNLLPSIIRSSLRHVRLSHCSFPTMADFKPAMQKIEALESLLLHDTLSRHSMPSSDAPLTLPCLKKLDLDEAAAELAWFFNNFLLTTQLEHTRVIARLLPASNGDLLKLLVAMSHTGALGHSISTLQSVAFQMVDNIWVSDNPPPALVLTSKYAPTNTSSERLSVDDSRDITISFAQEIPSYFPREMRHKTFHRIFTDIFQHFEWTNLRELDLVKLDYNFSAATFGTTLQATFGGLPDIRVIRVGTTCGRPLVDALWLDANQRRRGVKDGPRKEMSFQGLEEIYMDGVSFDYGRECYETAVDAGRFVDCLQGRLERGVPIQKLSFDSCPALTREHLNAFVDVVHDVAWDGQTPEELDSSSEGSMDSDYLETTEEEDNNAEEDGSEDEDEETSEDDDDSEEGGGNNDASIDEHEDEHDGSDDEEMNDTESGDTELESDTSDSDYVGPAGEDEQSSSSQASETMSD